MIGCSGTFSVVTAVTKATPIVGSKILSDVSADIHLYTFIFSDGTVIKGFLLDRDKYPSYFIGHRYSLYKIEPVAIPSSCQPFSRYPTYDIVQDN